ncbi:hypothetical protein [Nitritalea halalkaliphila]|uniref:hypothetical protein n=1 Tax=Nitritalea halalkaliphila TaxID=590849 RepID=UPI0003076319|nr:hypothetical protein [Nitritalea halalkaliphila]
MRKISGQLIYSPADLTHFIACKHLTTLEKEAVESLRKKPAHTDTFGQALQERVLDFERQLLQKSEEEGKKVRSISQDDPLAAEKTLAAMREGVDLIYQGNSARRGSGRVGPIF